jgi:hypothetical protein
MGGYLDAGGEIESPKQNGCAKAPTAVSLEGGL